MQTIVFKGPALWNHLKLLELVHGYLSSCTKLKQQLFFTYDCLIFFISSVIAILYVEVEHRSHP